MLSRLGQGQRPDADGFATLVSWLGMPAENFFVRDSHPEEFHADLMPQLAALLRASSALSAEDAAMIEAVAQHALRRSREQG